jgi:hypothetical protein
VFGLAAAVSPIVAARWSATSTRRVWSIAQVVMALGVALPVLSSGIAALAVAACVVGGTFMVITMAGLQEARRVAGPAAAGLMASMTASFAAGQIAGPLCVSAVAAARFGFAPVLLLATAVLAISAWMLERPSTRP